MPTLLETTLWENILSSLKTKLPGESFETWFNPIRFDGLDRNSRVIRLRAPNAAVSDWVKLHYAALIDQSFGEVDLKGYSVEWIVSEERAVPGNAMSNGNGAATAVAVARALEPTSTRAPQMKAAPEAPTVTLDPALNSKYTFESFVVGSCNQFAHAASLAVAQAPGKTYNPLYLYGGVGLGKTHLMHACGHAIKQRNPQLTLCYLSSERFMNELINAIRYDKTPAFREKYRSVDVLLIDDIQFMAGKERTQEEFFHTFNALYEQQKQIVISSDCPPREIPTLEERLHSRFEWGLIADLEPPDLETKVAILKRKAETMGFCVPDEVALFIATRVKNNVRELEGSLIRLLAISSLRGTPISEDLARDAIRNLASDEQPGQVTIPQIQKAVAAAYKLSVEQLISKNNARQIAFPRQIAMYLCKRLTNRSYPEIGKAFGGKHHTTVIHSVEKIQAMAGSDSSFERLLLDLAETLKK